MLACTSCLFMIDDLVQLCSWLFQTNFSLEKLPLACLKPLVGYDVTIALFTSFKILKPSLQYIYILLGCAGKKAAIYELFGSLQIIP